MSDSTGGSAYREAVEWASGWSQRWFEGRDGTDRLHFDGIDAGWATHVEAYLLLLQLAWERLGPRDRGQPSISRWLKQRGLDRVARSVGMRTQRGEPVSESDLAAVVEVSTPSMLEPAALVARAGGAPIAVADPRAGRRVARYGIRARPLAIDWRAEHRISSAARRTIATAWHEFASRPPEMLLRDTDVARDVTRRLRPLAMNSMPYLASEAAALDAYLDEVRPASVAIASDQHRIGRLTVQACRRRGIATVVLQHGMPQARIGYLPVVADAIAAWSPGSARWFIDGGTDPAVVNVTGNPRFDGLADGPPPATSPHILLALSPTAPRTNAALVRAGLFVVGGIPEGRLTIKLHPGQGDWSFVRPIVRQHVAAARVQIRRYEPLEPILRSATLIVVHRSSVALDALAARRPVVAYRVEREPTTADLELSQLKLPISETPESLANAIDRLVTPGAAAAYFDERADAIRDAVGPTSGSADRIVALMRRLGGRG